MSTAVRTPAPTDVVDDFDLDIRISVLPDSPGITDGFSNWQSCKGSCALTCYCTTTSRKKCC